MLRIGIGSLALTQPASIVRTAMAILRQFGADAHMYIPGIGYVSGVDAGNWLDTAFTATAVDSPVGLVMDAAGSVLPSVTPAKNTWTIKPSVSLVGDTFVFSNTADVRAAVFTLSGMTVGQAYKLTWTVARTSGSVSMWAGGVAENMLVSGGSGGTFTGIVTATSTSGEVAIRCGSFVGSVGQFDLQPITGIYASNNTTAQKPILKRDANGRYYHQYTAASSMRLALSAVPFGHADNHCVGFAFKVASVSATSKTLFEVGTTGAQRACQLRTFGTQMQCYWDNGTTVAVISNSGLISTGQSVVASGRRIGSVCSLVLNAALIGETGPPSGTTQLTGSNIGARVNGVEFFDGDIFGGYVIKGSVTDAQRLTLDRCIAAFAGITL